jgi:hypothetical protein
MALGKVNRKELTLIADVLDPCNTIS